MKKYFRIKQYILIMLGLMALAITSANANWQKMELGFRGAKIFDLCRYGGYEIISVATERDIYRRKIGDQVWDKSKIWFDSGLKSNEDLNYRRFIAINDKLYTGFYEDYDFISNDSGKTWHKITDHTTPKIGNSKNKIVVNKNRQFSYSDNRINVFNASSEEWEIAYECAGSFYCIYSKDNNLYGGNWGSIILSQDGGDTWNSLSNGLPPRVPVIAIKEVNDSLLYASTEEGLYYSANKGNQWNLLDSTFTLFNNNVATKIVAAKDSIVFAITYGQIHKINRYTNTKTLLDLSFNKNAKIDFIDFIDNKLYLGGYNGLYVSSDYGTNWTINDEGLKKLQKINNIKYTGEEIVVSINAGISESFIYIGDTTYTNWEKIFNFKQNNNNIRFTFNDIKVTAREYVNNKSNYHVASYDTLSKKMSYFNYSELPYYESCVKTIDDTMYSTGSQVFVKSVNAGKTWDTISHGYHGLMDFLIMGEITIIKPWTYQGGSYIVSTKDDGKSWWNNCKSILKNSRPSLLNVDGDIFALSSDGYTIYSSSDSTISWQEKISNAATDISRLDYYYDGVLFAKRKYKSTGSYKDDDLCMYSLDKGLTWSPVPSKYNSGSLTVNGNERKVYYQHDKIFYSDYSNNSIQDTGGTYILPISSLKKTASTFPNSLSKNDLNFKIKTTSNQIFMTTNSNNIQNINLYNLKGVLIKKFNNKQFTNNKHVALDCSDISKGLYFLKVKIKNKLFTQKIMLR